MATGRLPDPNTAPVTAKGDLYTYSTVPAKLAVGSNGETLVADSSTSTGLRWQAPKAQNATYNSGFDIWQRGTSFTANAGVAYTADRWVSWATTAGQSIYNNRQSVGNLSVSPNQSVQYCMRQGRTSGNTNTGAQRLFQTLESADSYRFAGKTVTLSFYARAGSGFTGIALTSFVATGTGTDQIYYSFTGATEVTQNNAITTSWQRFTHTVTLATSTTEVAFGFYFLGVGTAGANDYFEITGVQFEEGSVATPYNRQSATLAGELAACQRYYYRTGSNDGNSAYGLMGYGQAYNSTGGYCHIPLPTTMRVKPTTVDTSALSAIWFTDGINNFTPTSIVSDTNVTNRNTAVLVVQGSGFTQFRFYQTLANNTGSPLGYIGVSAEL